MPKIAHLTGTADTSRVLPPGIQALLDRHGIECPPVGKMLALPYLNRQLEGQSVSQRMSIKAALASAGLLQR